MFADTDYAYYFVDDDTVGTAIPAASLDCGASVTGAITDTSIYYELSLTSSYSTLTLSTCNDATNFDSIIELYDASRSKIIAWNDDDSSCAYGSRLSKIEKTFPAGNYLIRVLEYGK